jgi:hypothetical protein
MMDVMKICFIFAKISLVQERWRLCTAPNYHFRHTFGEMNTDIFNSTPQATSDEIGKKENCLREEGVAELRAGQENSAHVAVPARQRVLNDLQRTRPCGRMIRLLARPPFSRQ